MGEPRCPLDTVHETDAEEDLNVKDVEDEAGAVGRASFERRPSQTETALVGQDFLATLHKEGDEFVQTLKDRDRQVMGEMSELQARNETLEKNVEQLNKEVGVMTAVVTSIRAVYRNPVVMMRWAAIIATMILLGMATFFIGLAVTLPLIGHASWHAYRETVGE